jgi:hypothetical protein
MSVVRARDMMAGTPRDTPKTVAEFFALPVGTKLLYPESLEPCKIAEHIGKKRRIRFFGDREDDVIALADDLDMPAFICQFILPDDDESADESATDSASMPGAIAAAQKFIALNDALEKK